MELRKKHCGSGQPSALSVDDEEQLAGNLVNWEIDRRSKEHKLIKTVRTSSYTEALTCLNEIASLAQRENHHPEILLRYGGLMIELYTHKSGGLTENDFILAARIDEILEAMRLL